MSRLTRILATIGPASAELSRELVEAGADCIRVNLSHGDASWHREGSLRALSAGAALLLDLPGRIRAASDSIPKFHTTAHAG